MQSPNITTIKSNTKMVVRIRWLRTWTRSRLLRVLLVLVLFSSHSKAVVLVCGWRMASTTTAILRGRSSHGRFGVARMDSSTSVQHPPPPTALYRSASSLFSATTETDETSAPTTDTTTTTKQHKAQQQQQQQQYYRPPTIITCTSAKELLHAVQTILLSDSAPHTIAALGTKVQSDVAQCIVDHATASSSNTTNSKSKSNSVIVDVKSIYSKRNQQKHNVYSNYDTDRIPWNELTGMRTTPHLANTTVTYHELEKLDQWRQAFFPLGSSSSASSSGIIPPCYDMFILDVNDVMGNDLELKCLNMVFEFEQMALLQQQHQRYITKTTQDARVDGSAATATATQEDATEYTGLRYVLVKSGGLNILASQLTYTQPWCDPQLVNHDRVCRIVATVGVQEYRQTIPGVRQLLTTKAQQHQTYAPHEAATKTSTTTPITTRRNNSNTTTPSTKANFFVLEVGCHFGTTTVQLDAVFAQCLGVDLGPKIIQQAQQKYPHVYFRVGDAWKMAGLLRLQQEYYTTTTALLRDNKNEEAEDADAAVPPQPQQQQGRRRIGFDAVYVDVGGLSGADGVLDTLALVKSIQFSLEPHVIVIKSLCLQNLAKRVTPYWKWQQDTVAAAAAVVVAAGAAATIPTTDVETTTTTTRRTKTMQDEREGKRR